MSTIKPYLAAVGEVAAECGINVSGTEVQLTFLKSGYLMAVFISMKPDGDFEKAFIGNPF